MNVLRSILSSNGYQTKFKANNLRDELYEVCTENLTACTYEDYSTLRGQLEDIIHKHLAVYEGYVINGYKFNLDTITLGSNYGTYTTTGSVAIGSLTNGR